ALPIAARWRETATRLGMRSVSAWIRTASASPSRRRSSRSSSAARQQSRARTASSARASSSSALATGRRLDDQVAHRALPLGGGEEVEGPLELVEDAGP